MSGIRPTTRAGHAASRLGRTVDRALAETDLTPAGYRLLAYLSTGASAATALAEKLVVSRPTITATIDWLEERGFVTRSPDPVDRRRVTVTTTPMGEQALAKADQRLTNRLAEVLALLDDSQAASVVAALDHLHDALDRDRSMRHDRIDRPVT